MKFVMILTAVAVVQAGAWAQMGMMHGGNAADSRAIAVLAELDARNSTGFVNPLRLPGAGAPAFGLVDGARPFELRARPASLDLGGGRNASLLTFEAVQDGRATLFPLIRARTGDSFSARYTNSLREPSNVHWHGLMVPTSQDGNPADTVAAGASRDFNFSMLNPGAMYWFHPHPHGATARQVHQGLAGLLLVEDEADRSLAAGLGLELGATDLPLVIQDKVLDAQGSPVYAPSGMSAFHGYYGSSILVNLTVKPFVQVQPRLYRLRILNASTSRVLRLGLEHGGQLESLLATGADGGRLAAPARLKEVFLAPGERIDLLTDFSGMAGAQAFLKSLRFDPMENEGMGRMAMAGGPGAAGNGEELFLLRFAVAQAPASPAADLAELIKPAVAAPAASADVPVRRLTISAGMMRWFINGRDYRMGRTDFSIKAGSREIWEFVNDARSMPHVMHLHGFLFELVGRTGSPGQTSDGADARGRLPAESGLKDTILIWPGETVRIRIDFTHSFAGDQDYVLHCHMLEHEDQGMMQNFRVSEG